LKKNQNKISGKFRTSLLGFAIILVLTSCSAIVRQFYGIKNPKNINETTIIKFAEKYNIPIRDIYRLDTAYIEYLSSIDSIRHKSSIKNHFQPLQALYYNVRGQLVSFQINCYAGGFPNLNWDKDSIMTSFPPKQQAPIDSILPLYRQLQYIKPLPQTLKFSIKDYDYILIVFWNRLMGRQSKRLIRYVQQNSILAGDSRVKIIYVNTDDIFVN
jgi:hypothetical protein